MSIADGSDPYAKGMAFTTEAHEGLTPELDRFQFVLFRRFLGRRILEVGSGAGRMTELVRQQVDHDELVAIEPSGHFVGLLNKRYANDPTMQVIQATTSDVVQRYVDHFDSETWEVPVLAQVAEMRLDEGTFAEVVAALRSNERPVSLDKARLERQIKALANQNA